MTDATATDAAEAARLQRLTQRVTAIETILVLVPIVLAEVGIFLSLFLPYLTTSVDGEDETVSFLTFPFVLLGAEGGPEAGEIAFGIAFIVLLLAILAAFVALAPIPHSRRSARGTRVTSMVIVLLMAGVAGAWLVVLIAVTGPTDSELGPALPLLTVAALIAALVTLVPAYRSIWATETTRPD